MNRSNVNSESNIPNLRPQYSFITPEPSYKQEGKNHCSPKGMVILKVTMVNRDECWLVHSEPGIESDQMLRVEHGPVLSWQGWHQLGEAKQRGSATQQWINVSQVQWNKLM